MDSSDFRALLRKVDPIQRDAEKDIASEGFSPMDPPDAYSPPAKENIPYEQMHPSLRQLIDEHSSFSKSLVSFEAALLSIQNDGITREADRQLRDFFEFFDQQIIPHHRIEERFLFPLLARRLLEAGEHSQGSERTTAVDMMEDDHLKSVQLAAVIFNLFALSARLVDTPSRLLTLDAAIEQGKAFVEMMRLHVFREDTIVFPLAHRLLAPTEFAELTQSLHRSM